MVGGIENLWFEKGTNENLREKEREAASFFWWKVKKSLRKLGTKTKEGARMGGEREGRMCY